LINKVERICVGFNNHKQEVFNLVQALKTLFLYSQNDKETVEQYGRNSVHCGRRWRRSEGPQEYTKG
jgi:hypothetical protein